MANIAPRHDPTNELHPFEERNPFRVGLLSMDPRDFEPADRADGVLRLIHPKKLDGK